MNVPPERTSGDRAPLLQRWNPKRPPRLDILFSSVRPFYFVTFNTHERLSILARSEIHQTFRRFSERAEEHDLAVGRYVIMPDHIHLFVAIPATGITLSEWTQALRTMIGKKLLRLGCQKPHWQEGFFDHVLRSADSYGQKWQYVRMNPVRAGLVSDPDAWPHQGEIISMPFD